MTTTYLSDDLLINGDPDELKARHFCKLGRVYGWTPAEVGDLWWIDFVNAVRYAEAVEEVEAERTRADTQLGRSGWSDLFVFCCLSATLWALVAVLLIERL